MKRKLFSFSASVITAIMLTACAAAPENKPVSSAALSPTSEAVATAIPSGTERLNILTQTYLAW